MTSRLIHTLSRVVATSLLAAGMLGLGGCSPSSSGTDPVTPLVSTRAPNPADAPLPAGWSNFVSGLSAAGYSVVQGSLYVLDADGCDLYLKVVGTCAGNNPVAPYLVIQPPVVAGEYIDPYYATAFGTTTSTGTPINEFFRMTANEALITIIKLPPRAAYLGQLSYAYTRETSYYVNGTLAVGTTPDPTRYAVFGSLGNATNDVVIKNQSGLSWGEGTIAVITTADQNLDTAIRNVFASATTLNSKLLFSEPIGQNVILGLDKSADELFSLIRYALPEDQDLGDAWANSPGNNVWVFRVTNNTGSQVSRWATPTYTRKTATPEVGTNLTTYQTELANLLLNYAQSVQGITAANIVTMTPTVFYNSSGQLVGQVGSYCIEKGLPCAGDSQDTDAYRLASIAAMQSTDTAYVVGVDHTQYPTPLAANATYVSVGFYDAKTLTGVSGVSQVNRFAAGFSTGTLTGSAEQALRDLGLYAQASTGLKNALKYFYVAGVGRSCPVTADWCSVLSTDEIPSSNGVVLSQRAYVRPGTTTGGNPNLMLSPIVVRPNAGLTAG